METFDLACSPYSEVLHGSIALKLTEVNQRLKKIDQLLSLMF